MSAGISFPTVCIPPDEARVIRAFGDEIHVHLGGTQTGGAFTMFTDFTPPGGGPPPHWHEREDEWFLVLEGRMHFLLEGEWREVAPGTAVFAPRGSVHTFQNIGDTTSKMLIHTSPSGFEDFFAAAEVEFAKPGGPDMARAVEIAAEYGIRFAEA